jgi:hypothetical protein
MEVNQSMLVQNHVHYNMLSKNITLWGGVAMVQNFIPQCEGEEFKSHTCNLNYLSYLSDLIK